MAETTHVNVGGSWEQAKTAYVNVSGTWRRVVSIHTKVAGVWETVFNILSASKDGDALAVGVTTTNNVTITAADGATPYTYSWARVSGDTTPAINNPNNSTVNWTVPSPGEYNATWRCTVTDAHGTTATVDVSVIFTTT